jgi:hypothetical protein
MPFQSLRLRLLDGAKPGRSMSELVEQPSTHWLL